MSVWLGALIGGGCAVLWGLSLGVVWHKVERKAAARSRMMHERPRGVAPVTSSHPAPCPFCGLANGFHDEDVHDRRPCLKEKSLPLRADDVVLCRACSHPLSSPGDPDCRYPNHGKVAA